MEVLEQFAIGEASLPSALALSDPPRGGSRLPATARIPTQTLRTSLGLITLAWMFGNVWFNTATGEPMTLFAQKLGASNFQFGLLTALPFLASLMSVPGSLLIDWTGNRKGVFLWSLYLQRAFCIVVALVPLQWIGWYGMSGCSSALTLFLVMVFVMYASGATGGPAWLSWMSEIVPARVNGKYFSRRRQWGNLTAVPAAIFVGWFLDCRTPNEPILILSWCAVFFIASAMFGLADIHLFQYIPARRCVPRRGLDTLSALAYPLRHRRFMRTSLLVAMLTFAINFLGQFATLYLLERVGISNMGVQMVLVVMPMLAQLMFLGAWGRAADRMGKKPLLILAGIGLTPVSLAWCLVTPASVWLAYVLSGLGAALWCGVEVANLNLVLEASADASTKPGQAGSFAAVNAVVINIAGCLGGIGAGIIAQLLSNWHWQPLQGCKPFDFYDVLFVVSAVFRFASLMIFIPLIHEPTAASVTECVRFLCSTLFRWRVGGGWRQASGMSRP